MNTNLIIECTKCNKPHIVYAQKKISTGCVQAFKRVTHDLLFVLIWRKRISWPKEFQRVSDLSEFKVHWSSGEVLYYSTGFTSYCSHWGTKCTSKLSCGTKEYPICSDCSLLHLMHAIAHAHASTGATSSMRIKNSMYHFCLWHLLFGTLKWKKWNKDQKNQLE